MLYLKVFQKLAKKMNLIYKKNKKFKSIKLKVVEKHIKDKNLYNNKTIGYVSPYISMRFDWS